MVNVFLLLGSNLGNRELQLKQAINSIEKQIGAIIKSSSIYETAAWGKTDTPSYLNQVTLLQTALPANAILEKILNIERDLGRVREEKWGSRIIDIDILFYGDMIINEQNLQIPHPELHNRRFTMEPLAEIAPDWIHPVLNKSILAIKNDLVDSLDVKKL
jgi:2-amino-4-hydroxy-6-hydroxymethyldihydropteridine diphosphokinase